MFGSIGPRPLLIITKSILYTGAHGAVSNCELILALLPDKELEEHTCWFVVLFIVLKPGAMLDVVC